MPNLVIFNNLTLLKGFRKVCFLFFLLVWFVGSSLYAQTLTGAGTSANPYKITSAADLDALRTNYLGSSSNNKYFQLTADIDLSGYTNWQPIGTYTADNSKSFQGYLDGNGKVISGLTINRPTEDYVGLFGYVLYGKIYNLGIEIASSGITGKDNVGALVGLWGGGVGTQYTINNCYVTGIGSVNGNGNAGGLAGRIADPVSNCYSTVDVTAPYAAGGIGGMTTAAVSNCYASGTVRGAYAGGIVGDGQTVAFTNCVAANPVVSGGSLGSLVTGRIACAGGSFTGCSALSTMLVNGATITGTTSNKDGLDKTLAELQTQSTYSGWTFGTGGWAIWASNGFPYFQRQNAPANVTETTVTGITGKCAAASTPLTFYKQDGTLLGTLNAGTSWTYTFTTPIGLSDAVYVVAGATGSRSYFVIRPIEQVFCGGTGTAASPYLICDAEQLNAVRGQLDKYFKLNNDIDLTNWLAANSNVYGWEPIGTQTAPFTGKFDGNGFSVKGLWINRGDYNVGLFGYVSDNNSNIKDLGVQIDAKGVKGFYPVGGLVGTLFAGKIENCYTSMGTVTGGNNNIGGLVGANTWGTITGSYASCKVVGTDYENVGGLVGLNQATISNCYATGEVNASRGGGLVGNNAGTISYCYASGNVLKGYDNSGNPIQSYAGGGLADQNSGTITNCVAANNAVYGNPYAARAVCVPNGNVSNNYALSSMTLNGSIAGDANYNGTGKTQAELQAQSTYSGLGWDFASSGNTSGIWTIWEGGSYPFFQRQSATVKASSSCGTVLYVETRAGSDALGNPIQIDEVHAYKDGQLLAKGSRVGLSTIWAFTFPGSQGGNTLGIYAYEYNKKVSAASSILINPSASSTSNEYTIGGTGTNNYATLQDAADAYNTCGISQDVTFKIASDLTLTKTVEFLGTAPGSEQYTLTITTDGTPRKVSGNVAGPLIHLFAANNIVIDGKASSNPLVKNLVFENTATTTEKHLVKTISVEKRVVGCDDGINGCGENNDVKGKNTVIKNVELRLTSPTVVNIFGTANLVVTTDEITVENCLMNTANENVIIDRVKKLVFKDNVLKGAVNTGLSVNAYYPDTYTITGNLFTDITGTDAALYNNTLQVQGINIASAGGGTFDITGNTIKNISSQVTTEKSGAYGILVATDGTLNISGNTIESITSVSTNSDYDAYGINCLLYGNAVANVRKNEISNVSNIYTPFGILIQMPDKRDDAHANVENNAISGITSKGNNTNNVFDAAGIRMEAPGVVSANKISAVKAPMGSVKGLAVGITGIQNFSVSMANAPLISNNMIFDIEGYYSSGLQFSNEGDFYKVYHNTVRLTSSGRSNCLVVGNDDGKLVTVEVHNNLFSNEATGTEHLAVQIYGGTSADLQNNRYYAASGIIGQAPSGVLCTNINKWNEITGDNSVVVKPTFVASGDLHLTAQSVTDARLAIPLLTTVDSDFDGDARVACLNAAGADNFTANPEFKISSITTTPPVCVGEQTSVLFEIVGCSAPFQYSLDNKTTYTTISAIDSITLTGEAVLHFATALTTGNHTLWLKNANGCEYESATVAVVSNSATFPSGTTVFVKQTATGTGDGSSWDNAFDGRYLAQYLKGSSLATNTKIYVAAGTYLPYLEGCDDAATARAYAFELNKAVKMYGGFPADATGTTTNNADYLNNVTRLSGDIGTPKTVTDNTYRVVIYNHAEAALSGFHISDGYGNGTGLNNNGAGIFCSVGNTTGILSDLVIENNTVIAPGSTTGDGDGGGIYVAVGVKSQFNNIIVRKNTALTGNTGYTGTGSGGGIFVADNALSCTLINSLIEGNTATRVGGGIYSSVVTVLEETTISDNNAGTSGGGVYAGGALTLKENIVFEGNTAQNQGGAIWKNTTGTLTTAGATVKMNNNEAVTGSGGGIHTGINLTCDHWEITNNRAGTTGGGIHTTAGIEVELINSSVDGNTAKGNGGGIYAAGFITAVNTTISNNKAIETLNATGSVAAVFGNGGGVHAQAGANLTDVVITGNSVKATFTGTNTGAASTFGNGGGIYVAAASTFTRVKIGDNSAIGERNISNTTASVFGNGGGIYSSAALTLIDTEIENNTASGIRVSGTSGTYGSGGGMYAGNTLDANNIAVNNNTTAGSGGGIYAAGLLTLSDNNTISGNKAGWTGSAFNTTTAYHGGGVYAANSFVLKGTLVCNGNGATGDGGGIYKSTTGTFTATELTSLELDGNDAGLGGATVSGSGGGLYTAVALDLGNLTTGSISNNTAKPYYLAVSKSRGGGGGIYAGKTLVVKNAVINNNSVAGTVSGSSTTSYGIGGGGGVFAADAATLEKVTLTNNISSTVLNNNSTGGGGGICAATTLTLSDATVNKNTSSATAGGIYAQSTTTLNNTIVSNNTAVTTGGGIHAAGYLTLNKTIVSDNVTGTTGGGIYVGSVLTLNNSTIDNNRAEKEGGGIYAALWQALSTMATALNSSTVINNTSGSSGGGIYTVGHLVLKGYNTISYNKAGLTSTGGYTAGGSGGGIYVDDFTLNLADTVICKGNVAGGNGGGIYFKSYSNGNYSFTVTNLKLLQVDSCESKFAAGGGIYTIKSLEFSNLKKGSSISGNRAKTTGGGICTGGSSGSNGHLVKLSLNNLTISNNTAGSSGGGVYSSGKLTLNGNNTFSYNKAGWTGTAYSTSTTYTGGGIHANVGLILMDTLVCKGNGASGRGGGIDKVTPSPPPSNFSDTTFVAINLKLLQVDSCESKLSNGGGIYTSSMLDLSNLQKGSSISSNMAATTGGGIHAANTLALSNAMLSNNTAGSNGGAIYASADFQSNANTFTGNKAVNGGGAYLANTATVINNTFSANTATTSGGAVYANTSAHNISFSTFNGNMPSAIYFDGNANQTLNGNILYGNGTQEINATPAAASYNIVRNMDLGVTNRNVAAGKADSIFAVANNATDLATLADNGGPTQTLNIIGGGYAHNFIPKSVAWATEFDQRGLSRPYGCRLDAGAVESREADVSVKVTFINPLAEACTGDHVPFSVGTFTTYSWSILSGTGGTVETNGNPANFIWTLPGTKEIKVSVVDADGCTGEGQTSILIKQRSETGPLYRVPNLQ